MIDILILTTDEHRTRVWITRLHDQLLLLRPQLSIRVLGAAEAYGEFFPASGHPPWRLLVNRVADSSDPVNVKACSALLFLCKLWDIPVVNGLDAFTVATNKVLHHQVLGKAGVKSPRSVVLRSRAADFERESVLAAEKLLQEGCKWPLLLKPNSGGFGRGIRLLWDLPQLKQACSTMITAAVATPIATAHYALLDDDAMLLQEYLAPLADTVYRVWFLSHAVQCAMKVKRDPPLPPTTGDSEVSRSQFEGGCSGGECKRQKITHHSAPPSAITPLGVEREFLPWEVPSAIATKVCDITRAVGSDCHCGSVEFLFPADGGEAVFFDVNMVSTLPLEVINNNNNDTHNNNNNSSADNNNNNHNNNNNDNTDNHNGPSATDPWADLARFVLSMLPQ